MKKIILVIVVVFSVSAVCFAQNKAEIGFALVRNPVFFPDNAVVPGVSLAFYPSITSFFGIGILANFGIGENAAHLDFLAGPYFAVHIKEKFTLLGSAGFYIGMIFFGFGGQLSAQYAVHPNIAIFVRVQGNFAVFMAPGIDSIKSYVITPVVGVGFRF
ncbi:MAG: hypothetical protein FWD14_02025 [Treponema sp.]|nr:hypothetical protein [Treponema sp.]